jgi:acyl-CoA synthetase (AMP-forming)/AMP-acid ligase II
MTNQIAGHPGAGPDHYVVRLLRALAVEPARPVLLSPAGRTTTAAGLAGAVTAAHADLVDAGVRSATTAAVLVPPNHPSSLVARYALHLVGAAVAYLQSANPRESRGPLALEAQADLLAQTGADVLVVNPAEAARGQAIVDLVGRAVRLVLLDPARPVPPGVPAARWGPDACAVIAFTSGSTRRPKGLRQSFAAWDARVRGYRPAGDGAPATLLVTTPAQHTVGCMVDSVLISGGRVVLQAGFEVDDVLAAIERERVTDLYLPTPHLYRLTAAARRHPVDLTSLRGVVYSGTPASPPQVRAALDVFGSALVQLYGSAEAGGICALSPLDHLEDALLGTVGRPFPWVRVGVLATDGPGEVARGAVGEVAVRSRTAMDSYLDPAEPAPVGGWLRTGDLGHWDRYGYLELDGRLGHVIKVGGLKLYPASIETSLRSHPAVEQAMVFAIEDADRVETVQAAVVLRAPASAAELVAHVVANLSEQHAPQGISFWPTLPTDPAGKPDRARLVAAVPLAAAPTGRTR